MFYILYGEDDFSIHGELDGIKSSLGEPEMVAHNTCFLDGRRLTFQQVAAVCDALPFLAQKRLVIVEGLLSRFEPPRGRDARSRSPASELTKELADWQPLADYVNNMPPSTVLVLLDGRLTKNNRLLRGLAPSAHMKEFPVARGARLQSWIQARVAKAGGSISPAATRLLADLVGGNLWLASSEIEKLLLYTSGKAIEEKDVRLLVSQAGEANIFAMVDAIIAHRPAVAILLLHRLADNGATPQYILAMITRQFRLLAQATELTSQGLAQAEIGIRLGISSDYALRKTLEQAKRHSLPQIVEVYRKLLEADLSIKTGRWGGEMALDLLVTDLCSRRNR